jgi:two-component system, NarL family, sensor kinase
MRRRGTASPTVAGAVGRFALAGLVALGVVGAVSFLVMRQTGTDEALKNARSLTRFVGQGIVEPNLSEALVEGDPAALARFDRLIRRRVLQEPIERVKLWTAGGRLVYSDEPRLIGERYRLGSDEIAAVRSGNVESDISDLSRPENRFERGRGKLLEVYLPVKTPAGRPLLFEAYQRFDSIASNGRDIWLAFAPALIAALVVLELAQIPLASSMARRIRRSNEDRERLLRRAVDASEEERRRIAGDLHDGVVQDLAGTSFNLAAAAERAAPNDPRGAEDLRKGAEQTRLGVRQLRSLLVEIYPARLSEAGLAAAITDLLAALGPQGIRTAVDIPDQLPLSAEGEAVLFRIAREAIRNAAKHSEAATVSVRAWSADGQVSLEVEDDGRGFDPAEAEARRGEGHLGLNLMRQLAEDEGAELTIDSQPGHGTTVTATVQEVSE